MNEHWPDQLGAVHAMPSPCQIKLSINYQSESIIIQLDIQKFINENCYDVAKVIKNGEKEIQASPFYMMLGYAGPSYIFRVSFIQLTNLLSKWKRITEKTGLRGLLEQRTEHNDREQDDFSFGQIIFVHSPEIKHFSICFINFNRYNCWL